MRNHISSPLALLYTLVLDKPLMSPHYTDIFSNKIALHQKNDNKKYIYYEIFWDYPDGKTYVHEGVVQLRTVK